MHGERETTFAAALGHRARDILCRLPRTRAGSTGEEPWHRRFAGRSEWRGRGSRILSWRLQGRPELADQGGAAVSAELAAICICPACSRLPNHRKANNTNTRIQSWQLVLDPRYSGKTSEKIRNEREKNQNGRKRTSFLNSTRGTTEPYILFK